MSESERERMQRIQRELASGTFDIKAISKEIGEVARAISTDDRYTMRRGENEIEKAMQASLDQIERSVRETTYGIERTPAKDRLSGQRYTETTKAPEPPPAPKSPPKGEFSRRMAERTSEARAGDDSLIRAEAEGMVEAIIKRIEDLAGRGISCFTWNVGPWNPAVAICATTLNQQYNLMVHVGQRKKDALIKVVWANEIYGNTSFDDDDDCEDYE